MLYDSDFLRQLDKHRERTIYAKVTRLTKDEWPLEEIEGRITTGSINVDGASATRRSFSLGMVAENINLSEHLWGLECKIKLSIGVENKIDSNYSEIIWFEQGVYVVTTFSYSINASSYTINISGKDKMCLLDGTISGTLSSNVDFGKWEEEEVLGFKDKSIKYFKKPVKEIIREAVHQFAGEPFHNIIINDIPDTGYVLQEYRYDKPLYLYREANAENIKFLNGTIDDSISVTFNGEECTIEQLSKTENFYFEKLNSFVPENFNNRPSEIQMFLENNNDDNDVYLSLYLTKIESGQPIGYTLTDLVYPDDLIENSGSTIVSLLEKIKNFLGDYEYFFNIKGQFVFQKKQTYESQPWNPFEMKDYEISAPKTSQYSYEFTDSSLFTAINLTPSLSNVKNDYTVWGNRSSADGSELPIHMRVAIDSKPYMYISFAITDEELAQYNEQYGLSVKGQNKKLYIAKDSFMEEAGHQINNGFLALGQSIFTSYENNTLTINQQHAVVDNLSYFDECIICDWREIIYQMALDFMKFNHLDDFNRRVALENPQFINGITGYEQYYIDMQGFWRTLYQPINMDEGLEVMNKYTEETIKDNIKVLEETISTAKQTKALGIEVLEEELLQWEKRLDIHKYNKDFYLFEKKNGIYEQITDARVWWNRNLLENPTNLIFWFDFIEPAGDFIKFSVPVLGSRVKIDSKSNVRAIAYLDTPEIIFSELDRNIIIPTDNNYTKLQLGDFENMIAKSTQGVEARAAIDALLFQHTYCAESLSLTCIPIYYLQPNTRIRIEDDVSGIKGDYIIKSISFSLTYNGTMGLTVTQAPPILNYSNN